MKKVFVMMLSASLALGMASCGSSKKSVEATYEKDRNIAGEKVVVKTTATSGIEMVDALNEDGTKIIKVPYKWFSGTGKADVEQVAVTLAQQEAYATISRVFNNMVMDQAERGNVVNNGEVMQALTQHWEQMSLSVLKGCEPLGDVVIEYSPSDKMYHATARVGMTGVRYQELLDEAQNFNSQELSGEELKQAIEINKSIMQAARGE